MTRNQRVQYGYTLVEAMIALAIMGFGMFSLSGTQMVLSRHADDARQRTEAVRMAQEKMEEFRSYTGIATTVLGPGSVSATATNWNSLTNGQDSLTRNAVYVRTWTFSGTPEALMRGATVRVSWTDRANVAQAVSLSSILSRTDPVDAGLLGFPLPLDSHLMRPNNRNLAIPVAAVNLGNRRSALAFGHAGQYLLFDNSGANVLQICTPAGLTANSSPTEIIAAFSNTESSQCKAFSAYLVSGYIGLDSSVSANDWIAIQSGLGIDTSGITRNAAGTLGISCQLDNAINQASGMLIPDFKYYLCVIPLAAPAVSQTYDWSGKVVLAGPAIWHASANKYFVCRYEYAATQTLTDPNLRNVQPYNHVNTSIVQQNYRIATSSNAASAAQPICPSDMNVPNISSGALHQYCRSASNPDRYAMDCPLLP